MNNYNKCKSIISFICYKRLFLSALTVMILSAGCAHQSTKSEATQSFKKDSKIYTAFNMWYEKPHKMSSVNYNKGTLIPAGTEVGYIAVEGPRSMSYKKNKDFDPYIEFSSKDDKTLFKITWQSKYHPKKTIKDYANLMFTNKPFELLTEGFNTKELEAIKNGSIVEGMSKRAVIVTVGIPPGHYTKSLDDNSWFHWISRFQKREICFDANEKSILCSK